MKRSSILMIYTGGTIGMRQDPGDLTLKPFDFNQILEEVPELKKFAFRIDSYTFDPLIDSSDVEPSFWQSLASLIQKRYDDYDGFVVLHGTDTMAYSASALSFMLENLAKPVVLTGSQLPIGVPRTDGKENLISAVEIASAKDQEGHAGPGGQHILQFETSERQPLRQGQFGGLQRIPISELPAAGRGRNQHQVQRRHHPEAAELG